MRKRFVKLSVKTENTIGYNKAKRDYRLYQQSIRSGPLVVPSMVDYLAICLIYRHRFLPLLTSRNNDTVADLLSTQIK